MVREPLSLQDDTAGCVWSSQLFCFSILSLRRHIPDTAWKFQLRRVTAPRWVLLNSSISRRPMGGTISQQQTRWRHQSSCPSPILRPSFSSCCLSSHPPRSSFTVPVCGSGRRPPPDFLSCRSGQVVVLQVYAEKGATHCKVSLPPSNWRRCAVLAPAWCRTRLKRSMCACGTPAF